MEHGEHIGFLQLLASLKWFLINFGLYLCVMFVLYKKFVRALVRTRSIQVRQDLEKAAMAIANAQATLNKETSRFRGITVEEGQLVQQLESDGRADGESVVAAAMRARDRIGEDSQLQIEREAESARSNVRKEVVRRATEIVRRKLKAGLPVEDDAKLRRDALRRLFQ